jgi:hypothetical protein
MNAKYKKTLKIVTLIITSLIIATVSAASYSELFMYGTDITIGSAGVIFTAGSDTSEVTGGTGIVSPYTTVTFDNMTNIQPGETRTYSEAVNITNSAGVTKDVSIDLDGSLSGAFSDNFDYIYISMVNGTGTTQGTQIQLLPTGSNVTSTGSVSMSDGEVWSVSWIIKAKIDATDGQAVSLTLKVTVQ